MIEAAFMGSILDARGRGLFEVGFAKTWCLVVLGVYGDSVGCGEG